MYQKLKSWSENTTIFTVVMVCLVAGIAFSLGRASVQLPGGVDTVAAVRLVTPVSQDVPPAVLAPAFLPATTTGPIIASKSGTKYHFAHCAGAKQIKEENRLTFATPAAAEAAGYTRAANCTPQ